LAANINLKRALTLKTTAVKSRQVAKMESIGKLEREKNRKE
jgi:hypothetical protein